MDLEQQTGFYCERDKKRYKNTLLLKKLKMCQRLSNFWLKYELEGTTNTLSPPLS